MRTGYGVFLTHEEIVGVWTEASNFEQFHEVKELPVDISAYL